MRDITHQTTVRQYPEDITNPTCTYHVSIMTRACYAFSVISWHGMVRHWVVRYSRNVCDTTSLWRCFNCVTSSPPSSSS